MRRTDKQVRDLAGMQAILEECDALRVAARDGEGLFIFPVNFGWRLEGEELTLYFHGAPEGRKARAFAQACEAAFELDCGHKLRTAPAACGHSFTYRSIMGTGTVRTLSGPEEKRAGLQAVMVHATGRADWDFPAPAVEKTAVYELKVREWSAKANLGG